MEEYDNIKDNKCYIILKRGIKRVKSVKVIRRKMV